MTKDELKRAIPAVLGQAGQPMTAAQIAARLRIAGSPELWEALGELTEADEIRLTAPQRGSLTGRYMLNITLLAWGDPPKKGDPAEREYYGGGVKGAYVPDMSDEWKAAWKAKLLGTRKAGELCVAIRKSTTITRGGSVQVLIYVHESGDVSMSMNGQAHFGEIDFLELEAVVEEARAKMRSWRLVQEVKKESKS